MSDPNSCVLCGRKFTARKNLFAHYRAVHKVLPRTRCSIQCPLEGCGFSCNFLANLRLHVEKVHNTVMMKEEIIFQSPGEFYEWKSVEEKKTKSSFVQHCGARRTKDGIERITFVCHRSGKFQSSSTGKRLLKAQGSIKLGSHCTAAIELHRYESGTCTVMYYRTHFGHDQHIGLLQLSKSDRETLARKIIKGEPFEKILEDVKSSIHSGEPTRLHLITRHDLHNIKRDFGIGDTQQIGTGDTQQDDDDGDEESGQNERLETNAAQLMRLNFKLQVLRRNINSDIISRETKCKVEKEVDRLLSLIQSDVRREHTHCPKNEKPKVLCNPINPKKEVPRCPSNETLKVQPTHNSSDIDKDVLHCCNNEKIKVEPIFKLPDIHKEVSHSPNDKKLKVQPVLVTPDNSREVTDSPRIKKLKVRPVPVTPDNSREVTDSPKIEKLKVQPISNTPETQRKVPHYSNSEKSKVQPIPIRPKTNPRSILLVPTFAVNSNVVILKAQPICEVKTDHVGFDHTYC